MKLGHVGQRIRAAWMIAFLPGAFAALCRRQELQADSFAAHCGYGVELAQALGRVTEASDPMHPPKAERISRLYGV